MFSRLEEHLSSPDRAHMAMHSNPLNLSRRQGRKYALHTGGRRQRDRKTCISHRTPFSIRSSETKASAPLFQSAQHSKAGSAISCGQSTANSEAYPSLRRGSKSSLRIGERGESETPPRHAPRHGSGHLTFPILGTSCWPEIRLTTVSSGRN